LLDRAQIQINGTKPGDILVHNEKLYGRVLAEGSLGLGESYMDGWWDSDQLDEFFSKIHMAQLDKDVVDKRLIVNAVKARTCNTPAPTGRGCIRWPKHKSRSWS
jgi:cyclopropane-fatty-acyl-phospholipid synthase